LAIDVVFAGIPVAELEPAIDWYERFLGRPPDMAPHEKERCWQLTDDGWLYVIEDGDRAGNGLATFLVDDLDARLAELSGRGIEIGQVERLNERTRKVEVADPDGNRIGLGEVVSSGG
jgi:catechol 2,3-dioxygenase-like lactoylglutathione lyase family enzyme